LVVVQEYCCDACYNKGMINLKAMIFREIIRACFLFDRLTKACVVLTVRVGVSLFDVICFRL
jgi:hypothetical protein